MFNAIVALLTSISEGLKAFSISKERQSETEIVKSKKNKDKAINIAEKIIFMADKTELRVDRKYKAYRKLFFKYN